MEVVLDTSSLISLAWAGHLPLLERSPFPLILLDVVHNEAVHDGLASGHPDAAAIESAVAGLTPESAGSNSSSIDDAVVRAGRRHGVVLSSDQALGRRAVNVGARWLRTADYVVLLVRTSRARLDEGVAALVALHSAGLLTDELYASYREDLA